MPNALAGALIGGGITQGTLLGSKYLLPPDQKKWASVVGLAGGLATSGVLYAVEDWRDGALASLLTSLITAGPRVAEAFLLPKPEGGHDLGAITMEELRAVVATEARRGLSGAPPIRSISGMGGPAQGINSALSRSFGQIPLLSAHR